jgi:heme-degrading monooxygenase HmoA
MITRIWHGKTSLQHAESYLGFLLHDGTKGYWETAGILSIKIWTQKDKDYCHFWTVTEWETIDDIKRFAGEDYEKAVYYPQDDGFLLEFEEKVNHYETWLPVHH